MVQNSILGLAVQSWTLYVFGVCLIISRIAFRSLTLRATLKLQADDWLMIFVLIPFTGTVICANQVSTHSISATHDIEAKIWASKMRFALEECQIATTWLIKACLLILYWRIFPIVTSKVERRNLAWVSAYCLFSYLAIQALMIFWCQPVRDYWNAPLSDSQCSTYRNHSITTLSFSLTTTLVVLIIPVPFIPTPRRFLLAILLILGSITMVIGILGRSFIITNPNSETYLLLYTTETALLLLFANLPFLSSLVTSVNQSRIRHISNNLSLSRWPRSYKDTPPLRAQRLSSTATTMSVMSPITPINDLDFCWDDLSVPQSTPPTPLVQILSLTDPPPELEYWSMRRPSTRGDDVENMFTDPHWPLP